MELLKNLGVSIVLGVVGLLGWLLLGVGDSWCTVLLLIVVFWVFGMVGMVAGYHRLWAHRSYRVSQLAQFVLATLGATLFLGPISEWVIHHKRHHEQKKKNSEDDSVQKDHLTALSVQGKIQWKIDKTPKNPSEDKVIAWQKQWYPVVAVVGGIVVPTLVSWIVAGEFLRGFFIVGCLRSFLMQQAYAATESLAFVYGSKPYDSKILARDSNLLALVTLGDGYQNFHHRFPEDYRGGIRKFNLDPVKWLLRGLQLAGLVQDLQKTPRPDWVRCKIAVKQEKLDALRATLNFGATDHVLPIYTFEQVQHLVQQQQRKLIVIDGLVHDVATFIDEHPGGQAIIKSRIGTDATLAFNGEVYRHSKAARNILSTLRVARIDPSVDPSPVIRPQSSTSTNGILSNEKEEHKEETNEKAPRSCKEDDTDDVEPAKDSENEQFGVSNSSDSNIEGNDSESDDDTNGANGNEDIDDNDEEEDEEHTDSNDEEKSENINKKHASDDSLGSSTDSEASTDSLDPLDDSE